MNVEAERTPPWSLADARTAFLSVALGTVLLGWAWWESSDTGNLDDQTTAVVFAVLAATVCLAGCFAWISAGRRAVRDRRTAVVGALELALPGPSSAAEGDEVEGVVAVAGTRRYHRPDCLLVRGKSIEAIGTHGRTPCEMCRP